MALGRILTKTRVSRGLGPVKILEDTRSGIKLLIPPPAAAQRGRRRVRFVTEPLVGNPENVCASGTIRTIRSDGSRLLVCCPVRQRKGRCPVGQVVIGFRHPLREAARLERELRSGALARRRERLLERLREARRRRR